MKKVILFTLAVAMGMGAVAQVTTRMLEIYDNNGVVIKSVPFSSVESIEIADAVNDYEYVDLGLSVLWATCNVGATSPEQYGDVYSWGETATKSDYSVGSKYSKVAKDDFSGTNDDVAYVKMKTPWRMATHDEMQELVNCTWSAATVNGTACCKVTGPNGNFIYLPCAGVYKGTTGTSVGSFGRYWTSTPAVTDQTNAKAFSLYFNAAGTSVGLSEDVRNSGRSIRPVMSKSALPEKQEVEYLCVEFLSDMATVEQDVDGLKNITMPSTGMAFNYWDATSDTFAYDDIDQLFFYTKVGGDTSGVESIESDSEKGLTVKYNGADESLNVVSISIIETVAVYNAQGLLMKRVAVNENYAEISLAELSAGMYIVYVANGEASVAHKVIK